MSDFNPREPIRLSDIDNLLEDSIFTSSNGAKLAEYLRKKRGAGGRVRLQNIFEQVAANIPKPIFNFDIDSSDPNPLPESPQQPVAVAVDDAGEPSAPEPVAGTSAPVQNGNGLISLVPVKAGEPALTPLVVVPDLKVLSPKATMKQPSDAGVSNLGRQALLNQYHRSNMAKCELLRQITSSTPKPEAVGTLGRISSFTSSISPITEAGSPTVAELGPVAPQAAAAPPLETPISEPVVLLHVPAAASPPVPIDPVPPPQILAPCSQAPPIESTPRKVIVVSTPAMPPISPDMVIPETPSPVKEVEESPKVAHQIVPRKLSVTFNKLQEQEERAHDESNENITSDESEPVEGELQIAEAELQVQQEKPVNQEQSVNEEKDPVKEVVSDEQPIRENQPVNQADCEEQPIREKQPVDQEDSIDQAQPVVRDVLLAPQSAENSFITRSILKDSFGPSKQKRPSFRVSFSQQLVQQREISPAPSVPEAHYSSSSDDSSDVSDEEEFVECGDYQVIDEVYSDDGECDPHDIEQNYNELVRADDEMERQMAAIHERIPSPLIDVVDEAPVQWYETRTPRKDAQQEIKDRVLAPPTCTKDNKTDLQLVDIITDWDDEDDEEEAEKEDQEEDPAKESQPSPPIDIPETQPSSSQNTNVTVCNPMDISNVEDQAERLIELPPPVTSFNGTVESRRISSPDRLISPPTQFTDSAKRRFMRENEDALISRLQNELPPSLSSQQSPPSPDIPEERVSETLVDIVQSFRDQPPPSIDVAAMASRKTIIPIKKPRKTTPVDPATNSYFEAVVQTFAHPATTAHRVKLNKKSNQLTTAQKRKLYAASSNGMVAKNPFVVSTSAIRNFKIIVQKLRGDQFLERLTHSDRAAIDKANKKVQPNLAVDAEECAKKKTEQNTNVGTGTEKLPIRQTESTVGQQQQEKSDSDNQSENSEPAFTGFDEHKDLGPQPEVLRVSVSTHGQLDVYQTSSRDSVPDTEEIEEKKRQPVRNPSRRVTRKKKTKELSKPATETPVDRAVEEELTNERLISNEERNPANKEEIEAGGATRKDRNNPIEEIVESAAADTASDEPSDERLTPNEVPDPPPVAEVEGRKPIRKKKQPGSKTAAKPPHKEPAVATDHEPITSESSDGLSNERLNPEGDVEVVQPAGIPEVLSAESVDQNPEQERIISRTPIDNVDALPLETQPTKRKRGRPRKKTQTPLDAEDVLPLKTQSQKREQPKKAVPAPEVGSGSESNKKKVTFQTDEPNNAEALGNSEPDTDTISSASSEVLRNGDKEAQSLPLKKRKDRIFSDDEPPPPEPLGEATPVDSNEDVLQLLTPHEPAPSSSERRKERKPHDVREKYTTEKPEKKISRFYLEADDADDTWVPSKKSKDHYNRQVRKKGNTAAGSSRRQAAREEASELPPEEGEVRRGTRTRRLAASVLARNPRLRTIYDRPDYRLLTNEEFEELTREATRRAAERKRKREAKSKPVSSSSSSSISSSSSTNVAAPDSRKRAQEDLQEPTTSTTKRNRTDDVDRVALDSQDAQPLPVDPSPPSSADSERTSSTEKMQAFSWMLKLMQTNGVQCHGQENTGLIVGGQYMHYSQEHLSCSERNGIQYSFYLHSETENYGFMRFAPSAVKKLTKTEKFVLKFLILDGNLSISLNGQKIQVKGGDFFMLPEHSTYAIENGKEVSLIFMIKLCPSMCEA